MEPAEKFGVRQLDGENFDTWKFRVENILDEKDLLNIVTESKPRRTNAQTDGDYQNVVRMMLIKLVDDSNLRHVKNKKTAKEMWNSLHEVYASQSNTRRIYLKRRLATLQCEEGKSLV